MAVSGVVLAGGASRRFGGDKRVAPLDGVPLLRRAVDAVAAVCDDVTVVTRSERPIPDAAGLPANVSLAVDATVPPSAATDDEGRPVSPLGGLLAGLETARHDVVVVVGGDHPWLDPRALVAAAVRLAADASLDAVVADDGRPQPLVGAYRRRVAATVRARLAAGDPRLVGLLDHLTVARATDLPGLSASVRDVDTPDDLPVTGTHEAPPPRSVGFASVGRVDAHGDRRWVTDHVVVEEPLAIAVAGPDGVAHEVTTTLRTPGHEAELAVGFLHAEGLLRPGEVAEVTAGDVLTDARPDDHVTVHLTRPVDTDRLVHRHVGATASCGLCGRATIDDLLARVVPLPPGPVVPWSVLAGLPERLRAAQATFAATGGLHATGIADVCGQLLTVREDVGRHNALDAAIGRHVLHGEVPLADRIVVLSGRVGAELVQKVAVAGAPIVVAVGAPSDLAVRTASAAGVTLVGFVRSGAGNLYSHPERVAVGDPPAGPTPEPRRRSLT